MKTFTTAEDALVYLNDKLAAKVDDENYIYIAPSMAKKDIQDSLEDYQHIKKLAIEWDLT